MTVVTCAWKRTALAALTAIACASCGASAPQDGSSGTSTAARPPMTLPPIPFVRERLGWEGASPPSTSRRLVVSPSGVAPTASVLAPPLPWELHAGSTGYDAPLAMATDSSGDTFVTGTFGGAIAFGGSCASLTQSGTSGMFVVELSSSGKCVWADAISGSGDAAGSGIAVASDGTIFVGGAFSGTASSPALTSAGGFDGLLAHYSSSGALLWAEAIGGSGDDYVNAIGTYETTLTAAGSFSSSVAWSPKKTTTSVGDADAFVAQYASDGTFGWVTTWGETAYDAVNAIAVSSSRGTSYVAGPFQGTMKVGNTTLTSAGGYDGAVVLLSSGGGVQGAFSLGGTGDDDINGGGIDAKAVDPCGAGYFQKSATFYGHTLTGQGAHSGFAVEYDSAGNVLWTSALDASGDAVAQACAVDGSGNTFVTGWFTGTGAGALSGLTSTGTSNAFLVEFDTTGAVLYRQALAGSGDGNGIAVAMIPGTPTGVVVGSAFDGTLDCGSGAMSTVGQSDIALCAYREP